MNGLASFGAGGFLMICSFMFYRWVWVPEQKRQTQFNTDWIGRLEQRIKNLEDELRSKEHHIQRQDVRIAQLTTVLIEAGHPVPPMPYMPLPPADEDEG